MKKITIVLLNLLTLAVFGQNLDDHLLVHYPFDGNTQDVSGNNRHATNYGATLATDRFGNANSCYYFDGDNDYIEFPNLPVLKPQLPMTFSFWVKYDSTSYQDQTVFNTSFEDNHCTGVWFNSTSSTSKPAVNFGDGDYYYAPDTRRTYVTDTIIDTNNWYHMVVVVNSSNNMKIYVNCKEYGGTYSGSGGNIVYSDTPGCLGRHDRDLDAPADYFKGYIDDFMYWDRALTTAEIALLCTPELSVVDVPRPKFKLHPNPVDDVLFIDDGQNLPSISLYNAIGQRVYSGAFVTQIDVSQLPPGMYLLVGENSGATTSKKIIIK